jgi:hypothetical protein
MVKYLVGILCSSNIRLLQESFYSVLNQKNFDDYDIFIIVNTLREEFYQDVLYEFGKHNYPKLKKIIRTDSNGSPGKGHNSVLKIYYRDIKYENLIMLDGDDFLFPYALERINNIREIENSDVISLYGNTKISKLHTIYNKDSDGLNEGIHTYNLDCKYQVTERKQIVNLNIEYNTLLVTPGRVIYTNRKFLSKYSELYDERMYIYDDFMATVLLYKEINNENYNITHLSDPYIYLYNAVNNESVSYLDTNHEESDNENKRDLIKTNLTKYNIADTIIKPYSSILNDTISVDEMYLFHKQMILKLHTLLPINIPIKRILFIDYSEWDYNTINTRALGGTEAAIYSLSKILANNYNVSVMTKTNKELTVHDNLHYYPLNEEIIKKIHPDIVIFQGQCALDRTYFTNINPNVKLWNWNQHDINVHFITNDVINYPFDKYIFVSNWQKNRYIQQFKLDHNKCIVMQNGISPIIKMNELSFLPKEKTLIYCSTPYRGLIIAYHLFQQVKLYVPDVKLKIFSCFSREIDKNKTEYLPLTNVSELSSVEMDVYYKSLYQLLIDDESIDFYGSVPQHVLFSHMKSSMILFYPNTYAETCCTTILEAMAYRCNVISSELGAIPETSNGFANLFNPNIDVLHDKISTDEMVKNPIRTQSIPTSYHRQFVEKTVDIIKNYSSNYNQQLLTRQQDYIKNCTWEKRAESIKQYIPNV